MAFYFRQFEACICDLDDSLTESGQYMLETNRALLKDSRFYQLFTQAIAGDFEALERIPGFDLFQQIQYWIDTLPLEEAQRSHLRGAFEAFITETWRPKVLSTFEAMAPQSIPLCPGAEQVIDFFTGTDRVLGILTNNQRAIAQVILKRSGITQHKILTSATELSANKPDPEGHEIQLDLLGVDRAHTISIGDSLNDMRAAMQADIKAGLFIDRAKRTTPDWLATEFARRVRRVDCLSALKVN